MCACVWGGEGGRREGRESCVYVKGESILESGPDQYFSPSLWHPHTLTPSLWHPHTLTPSLWHPHTLTPSSLHSYLFLPPLLVQFEQLFPSPLSPLLVPHFSRHICQSRACCCLDSKHNHENKEEGIVLTKTTSDLGVG